MLSVQIIDPVPGWLHLSPVVGLELDHVPDTQSRPDVALGQQRRIVVSGELPDLARADAFWIGPPPS